MGEGGGGARTDHCVSSKFEYITTITSDDTNHLLEVVIEVLGQALSALPRLGHLLTELGIPTDIGKAAYRLKSVSVGRLSFFFT
jgi:hypothetical protein